MAFLSTEFKIKIGVKILFFKIVIMFKNKKSQKKRFD